MNREEDRAAEQEFLDVLENCSGSTAEQAQALAAHFHPEWDYNYDEIVHFSSENGFRIWRRNLTLTGKTRSIPEETVPERVRPVEEENAHE